MLLARLPGLRSSRSKLTNHACHLGPLEPLINSGAGKESCFCTSAAGPRTGFCCKAPFPALALERPLHQHAIRTDNKPAGSGATARCAHTHLHRALLERQRQVGGKEVERRCGDQVDPQHRVEPCREPQLLGNPAQPLAEQRQRVCGSGRRGQGEGKGSEAATLIF